MKSEILNIKPPSEYKENIIVYQEGLDNYPEYIDFIKAGFSKEDAEKMILLYRIESMRYAIKLAKEDAEADLEEILSAENDIEEMIKEYNKI